MVNCSNAKDKRPDLGFCKVSKIVTNQGPEIEELTAERRRLWISAISRDDLTEKVLANDCVCGEHFLTGQAAFISIFSAGISFLIIIITAITNFGVIIDIFAVINFVKLPI